jgi:NAD(P)-dependent dehydrogenase (short-subunit alcohol dehydrogenase family)
MTLAGRSVIVTGAGNGLGRAYAMDMARAGARVLVNDVNGDAAAAVVSEISGSGGESLADCRDISTPEAAEEMVCVAVAAFGGLNGLVNNAGLFYRRPPEEDVAIDALRLVQVNLLGTIYCGLSAIRPPPH